MQTSFDHKSSQSIMFVGEIKKKQNYNLLQDQKQHTQFCLALESISCYLYSTYKLYVVNILQLYKHKMVLVQLMRDSKIQKKISNLQYHLSIVLYCIYTKAKNTQSVKLLWYVQCTMKTSILILDIAHV